MRALYREPGRRSVRGCFRREFCAVEPDRWRLSTQLHPRQNCLSRETPPRDPEAQRSSNEAAKATLRQALMTPNCGTATTASADAKIAQMKQYVVRRPARIRCRC